MTLSQLTDSGSEFGGVRTYNKGLEAEPAAGQRAEPLVSGSVGGLPLKLNVFFAFAQPE